VVTVDILESLILLHERAHLSFWDFILQYGDFTPQVSRFVPATLYNMEPMFLPICLVDIFGERADPNKIDNISNGTFEYSYRTVLWMLL